MNAILLRELKKKEKAEGSSSVPKKQTTSAITKNTKDSSSHISKKQNIPLPITKKNISSSSTNPRLTSPASPIRKQNSSPSSPVPQKGKRKLSTTSTTSISSQETSGSESEQPAGPSIYNSYTSDTVIVGRGPNNIAQKLMLQLPSQVDATFINSLGWSDLTRRTCSSLTEGIMYLGGLIERADLLKSAYHDLKTDNTVHNQLPVMLEEAKMVHFKELRESKAQSDDLLKKKDEELQQLHDKHATELQDLREKLKVYQFEATQACKGLEDAKTQFIKESSSFKENFLKSDEFNEICGPKAFHYLKTGFEGTVNLFKANGYPSEGASTDFISLRDLVASLPSDL